MLKKIIYGLTLMAAVASCTDDYTDWASPQVNAEEAAQSVSFSVGNAAAVNYDGLTAETVQLFVPNLTTTEAVDTTTYKVVLTGTEGDNAVELATDANGYVAAADLKSAVEALYGKRPTPRQLNLAVTAYTTVGTQTIANNGSATLSVTLKAPFIDTAYYLVGDMFKIGDGTETWGWDVVGAHAFTHLGSGDVYDAPEFQIVFQTTAANQYWKIIPATNYNGEFWAEGETGVVGTAVDGDDSLEGSLVTTSPQAGKIAEAGVYRMTINMMNYTYTLEKLNFTEFIYEIGNSHGWSTSMPLYGANFDGKYQGYYYLDGGFKFKPNADNWDGDWGQNPNGATGTLVQEGEQDCSASAGFYQIDVDLAAMTYTLTQVTSISIIGTVNGNWDTDTDLTYNVQTGAWEATETLNAGDMKFRMNHDWSVSWGGANGDATAFDNLTQNGGKDLHVAEGGTYKVQLYISYEGNNKVVLTKQ